MGEQESSAHADGSSHEQGAVAGGVIPQQKREALTTVNVSTKTEEAAIAASFPQVDNPAEQNYNNPDNLISKGGAHMANEMGKRYRCAKCGTELIVTRAGTGKLVCCKQPMEKKT